MVVIGPKCCMLVRANLLSEWAPLRHQFAAADLGKGSA